MTWDKNVNVTVVSGAQPVDRAVLNIPLHLSTSPTFPGRVRTYGSNPDAVADTLLGTEGKAAVAAHFSQELHSPTIKIGRGGDVAVAQVVTITVGGVPLENEVWHVTINESIVVEYVAGAAPTIASVYTALDAAIEAALTAAEAEITPTGVSPDTILTADNLGEQFSYSSFVIAAPGEPAATGTLVSVLTTANAGIGSDLDACLVEDGDWYGLTTEIDATPADNLVVMKASSQWTQANDKIYIGQSSDAAVLAGTAANDLLELAAKNNSRTAYFWHHADDQFAALAFMSYVFWADPDARTTNWAYKPLSGIALKPAPRLTPTQQNFIENQYGNCFVTFGGSGKAGMGITTTNKKIDLITTADWLEARLGETYIQLLSDVSARNDKIGINDKELVVIPNAGQKILDQGVRVKHLNAGSTSISVAKRVDMPDADITDRHIRVTASGVATGAAEKITVTMTFLVV